jgi:adenine-specific DNA-methyltransferase
MKYLLGLLNSRLMLFWLKNKGKMQGENFQLDKEPLLGMPIQPIMKKQEKPFVAIVDQILAAKSANPQADTSALERQIDNLVYRLYNLTWDEVKVIEPEFPLGKAEYEGIEFKEENK